MATAGTSATLFTLTELQEMFSAPGATNNMFTCVVTNGDINASNNHFDGTTWDTTKTPKELKVLFSGSETGAYRVNYTIFYTPDA